MNYSAVLLLDMTVRNRPTAPKITEALASSTFAGHVMPYGPTKFVNGQNERRPVTWVIGSDIRVILPKPSRRQSRFIRCRPFDGETRHGGSKDTRRRRDGAGLGCAVHLSILFPAIINGLLTGAIYALIALGLTLVYGVLHIINFAHGALLTAALFAAFFLHRLFGIDPYLAVFILVPAFFTLGYGLQRFVIGPASHGNDGNILLVTLGLAVVIENVLLYAFRADTRTIDVGYGFQSSRSRACFCQRCAALTLLAPVVDHLLLWLL